MHSERKQFCCFESFMEGLRKTGYFGLRSTTHWREQIILAKSANAAIMGGPLGWIGTRPKNRKHYYIQQMKKWESISHTLTYVPSRAVKQLALCYVGPQYNSNLHRKM